jgi:VWFA-related protein
MRLAASAGVLAVLFGMPAGSQVTLRSVTRLVQITVVAQDGRGNPVTDLGRDDFLLFDGGQPREIKVFTVDRGDRERASAQPTAKADLSDRVFTNSEPERSGPTGVTVILLDSLNTDWTDQANATRNVIRFLAQVHPDDHIAVYSIGLTGFRVLHDFTTDASDLLAKLASWKGEIPRPKSTDTDDPLAMVLSGKDRASTLNQRRAPVEKVDFGHTIPTLRVMELLANRLAGIPGRKNVIWISNGFPMVEWGNEAATVLSKHGGEPVLVRSLDPRNNSNTVHDTIGFGDHYSREADQALHLLNSASVAVYPIEARGLVYHAGTTIASLSDQATEQAMQHVAKQTGGRAFTLTNDVLGAIGTAVDDSRVTYTLGFYPESTRQDGAFHPIAIKLAERRGITLRYRQGYIDAPDAPADPARRKYDLEQAALSPIDANALPLTAHMLPSAAKGTYNVNLSISLAGLNLEQDGEVWTGEVDVFLLQRDQQGHEFGRVNDTIAMRLKQATYQQMLKTGAPYRHEVTLDPKADVLRVVVRDARSGDLGSLTIPAKGFEK